MFSAATKTGSQPSVAANYIEDVFSTYLYTGTGASQTVTNGIDLSTQTGMTWLKARNSGNIHHIFDTIRGTGAYITSNATTAEAYGPTTLTAFNSTGFSIGTAPAINTSGNTYVSWTFRKQLKFFDVVTYTGTGATQNISHSLGSTPGMIIVKSTSNGGTNWYAYHTSIGNTGCLLLNLTAATQTSTSFWDNTSPTSTQFTIGSGGTNNSGQTYVAYLFAHNAGGFGTTGTDNVISCGSFTKDGSNNATVNLGYEPQWILVKCADSSSGVGANWILADNMRGANYTNTPYLEANASIAEQTNGGPFFVPTATGFQINGLSGGTGSSTHIYMAIRRPMKVPTDATTVFSPQTATYSANQVVTTNFPVDMTMIKGRTITLGTIVYDRLRGIASTNTSPVDPQLITSDTSAETSGDYINTANNTGYQISPGFSGFSSVNWNFSRRPGFFDEVCYTGTGGDNTLTHNLTVAPELIIIKSRSSAFSWSVGSKFTSSNYVYNTLESTDQGYTFAYTDGVVFNNKPSASSIFLNSSGGTNSSGSTYVAYLFATCPGVSKVGSYTGNGTTQAISCGFTGGARFVLIKRTDSAGGWYVYDTARGMTLLTDPYLQLNSTAAESATLGSVITTAGGFTVDATILAAINTNAASYIFLAIA
jgi:hypothetical protein